jgi:anti-sigma B factor antagonist
MAVSAEVTTHSRLDLQKDAGVQQHTVAFNGELDIAAGPELAAVIARVCAGGVRSVTLDLSGLSFIDSTGVHSILKAQKLCRKHGCELVILPGGPSVQRLFEVTGLVDRLPFLVAA